MKISNKKQVTFEYTLFNEAGERIGEDDSPSRVTFIYGSGEIIPGLEGALAGKEPDDAFKVEIPPEFAYGEHDETLIETFPRDHFDSVEEELHVGLLMEAQSDAGVVLFTITQIDDKNITVDANHPFAGKLLSFDVKVIDVQDAPVKADEENNIKDEKEDPGKVLKIEAGKNEGK